VFRNILVAVDGSPASLAALEEAIDVARSEGARLTLINVAEPVKWRYSGPIYVPYPSDEELMQAAQAQLERLEALVPGDIPVSTIARLGRPAPLIVARALEGGHDLVVVGLRHRGRLLSLLFGSVSRAVVARSPVPVLVAGRPEAEGDRRAGAAAVRLRPERPPAAVSMHAEPAKGAAVVFLWLVAALLLELQLLLWMFNGMYAE
jgi:nucleotide-binding universal stress UspA family protein